MMKVKILFFLSLITILCCEITAQELVRFNERKGISETENIKEIQGTSNYNDDNEEKNKNEDNDLNELHLNYEIDLIIEDANQIYLASRTKNRIKEVEIFDLLGNEIYKNTKLNTTETTIELKKPLKNGVYFCVVKTNKCYNIIKFTYMK